MEFSQNLRLAHLQLQIDTSAKYKANLSCRCARRKFLENCMKN